MAPCSVVVCLAELDALLAAWLASSANLPVLLLDLLALEAVAVIVMHGPMFGPVFRRVRMVRRHLCHFASPISGVSEAGCSLHDVFRQYSNERGAPMRVSSSGARAGPGNLAPSHPRSCASLADTATTSPNAPSNGHDSLAIPWHGQAKMADAQAHGADTRVSLLDWAANRADSRAQ